MYMTAERVPPFPPLPGAPAYEQQRYKEMLKKHNERVKSDRRRGRLIGLSVLTAIGIGVVGSIYLGTQVLHSDEWSEQIRQRQLAKNRAAISSCISRGGYVIEDPQGWLKECRGVQRAR